MAMRRLSVVLSLYPDLVTILLGMRVTRMTGLRTLFGLGPGIARSAPAAYWRDFDALEAWARSEPHRAWWRNFLRDPGAAAGEI